MTRTGKILGYTFHHSLHHGTLHRKNILTKAREAEARIVAKHIYAGDNTRHASIKGFYEGLVQSVLATGLTLAQLNDGENLSRHDEPRTVQAGVVKKTLQLGARVSPWIALMEIGWTAVDAKIIEAKMKLHDRIMRLADYTYPKVVLTKRWQEVAEGHCEGLGYEVKELWAEAGDPQGHTMEPGKGAYRDKRIHEAAESISRRRQYSWLDENSTGTTTSFMKEDEEHLENGTRREVALMVTVRAGACILSGNKTGAEGKAVRLAGR
jgi:hypothetical protein